ncbi:exopolysaccharide production repressor exox [Mesorhizobium sp. M2C.T.Ca.TU.002.02.1.1]|uniref:exopolysaccharide production repressor exox n=1 Tax=Mesorhizobium sp. M2C.T.Ca.TU.002.02.1.1 TaxID=2496788 RepID=UPI000FCB54CC|nr:exopolysaccharide production repressor exox [Mesorhizobium sp. M2C.T.Ca.TU.002.02.1.1]RUU58344.1 exopolysaccharide production repressor exox [Mesorhizobium sp. M2C.T.Ca.TU.002.02.1.1]RUU65425.1 exopolysaccharide production repressor exox [Mesorhizobium sp. M2C.T.Ca.TU.009.01.2.1]
MSLPKFIIGMIFALAIVIGWSYFDGASAGIILLRAIVCAVIIQAGYFLLVFAMIGSATPTSADKAREADRATILNKVAEGEKLSARRSLH